MRGVKSEQEGPGRVVAVTGVRRFLGTELIRRLEEDPRCQQVLALDVRPPDLPHLDKTEFIEVDLTVPAIDTELVRILAKHQVDTVVHGAFLSHPTHASEWAHELENIGTMHMLNACAEVAPRRLVLVSTTMVYGASRLNPNFLPESAPLRGHSESRFINDKVHAELQTMHFAQEHGRATSVCIARFAPLMGPSVDNLFTRFFSRATAPRMMGHDPLLQFIHESDAALALQTLVSSRAQGPFNIVGRGVLPYSTILAFLGKVPLPMPYLLARPISKLLWAAQVFDSPPSFLDFLRYLCVADGGRAQRELGYVARYGIRDTLLDFMGLPSDEPDLDRGLV